MKIIVTGATGTAGSELIRQAINDPEIELVTAIARNVIGFKHPKLREIQHTDFRDYSSLHAEFKNHDAVFWCLGISQSQVSTKKYEEITYCFTIAAANAMLTSNPSSSFLFLSGAGADTSEKSKTAFARIKGKTENALKSITSLKLYILRPAGIKPVNKNPKLPLLYKLFLPLFPLLEILAPSFVIPSDVLGRAMLKIVKNATDKILFENPELKMLGKE